MVSRSTCEVSLVTMVLGEISQITALMRKNARWAGAASMNGVGVERGRGTPTSAAVSTSSSSTAVDSGNGSLLAADEGAGLIKELGLRGQKSRERLKGSSKGESSTASKHNLRDAMNRPAGSLLIGFAALKTELKEIDGKLLLRLTTCAPKGLEQVKLMKLTLFSPRKDVYNLDAMLLLTPFLDVVRSGDTSGPITAIALSSVDKFISYNLVHRESPNLAQAMTGVAGAGTHCKFEASDSVSDEVVLLKILDVLRNTLTSSLGEVLNDEAVCEMMETGLSMCCQMRLSGKI